MGALGLFGAPAQTAVEPSGLMPLLSWLFLAVIAAGLAGLVVASVAKIVAYNRREEP